MLLPVLLRDARRRHGLSVRAAAQRCGVPRATWAGWESGASCPTAQRLDEVLAVLGLDLRLVARRPEPPGEEQVRRHLRRSLTARASGALGEQLQAVAAASQAVPRLLTGAAAAGLWVPHVVARGPLPLPPAHPDPALVRVHLPGPEPEAVVLAPLPAALVSDGHGDQWPALHTSARLLATEAPRDLANRRLPPHRDPDESREVRDLAHTLTWGARSRFPVSPTDSRAWRLDAPATLDEALEGQGLPPRHPRPRG